jgi:hypothetical protein
LAQSWVKAQSSGLSVSLSSFQVVLLGSLNRPIPQSLSVVASENELNRRKEVFDEDFLLIVEILADAFPDRDRRALQFQQHKRNAVDIEHHVRAFSVRLRISGCNGHFLGNPEVIFQRPFPVDQPDRLSVLVHIRLDLHAVTQ